MSKEQRSRRRSLKVHLDLGGGLLPERSLVSVFSASTKKPKLLGVEEIEGSQGKVRLRGKARRLLFCVAELHSVHDGKHSLPLENRRIELLAVIAGSSKRATLSERTTVASTVTFAQFLAVTAKGRVKIAGPRRGLAIALGMLRNFVSARGEVSGVISSSPNGLESNSWPKFNFLSNLVYFSVTTQRIYDGFLEATGAQSLLAALHTLARHPFTAVDPIYRLIDRRKPVFVPSLPQLKPPAGKKPDHWALSVKVNDSGAENFLIAGVGYIAFDKNDRMWLAINARQGTPNSAPCTVILEPDGSPAPFSPVFGGGILGAGFGVAADPRGETIYVGNFGWGPVEYLPEHGSVSAISDAGEVLSPPNGYTHRLSRVQGMWVDRHENLWMASWGSLVPLPPTDSRYKYPNRRSAVVVYPDGDPERAISHEFDTPFDATFDVVVDQEGNAYASNAGTASEGVPSSVYKLRVCDDGLEVLACWISDYTPSDDQHRSHPLEGSKQVPQRPSPPAGSEAFRQVTLAPNGDVFVVGVASSRVLRFTKDLEFVCDYTNKINGPWGIIFDPAGTMYVSNFARPIEFVGDEHIGPFGVTVIRDYDDATAELLTLQTGGDQVRLANGLPLYGNADTVGDHDVPLPSYDPIMRLTGSRVDRAGNLWACNNWKPSAVEDVVFGDPGGDGLVCFVGVAAPSSAR